MANTNLTIDMITKSILAPLHGALTLTNSFVKEKYTHHFGNKNAAIGDTLRIRKPLSYTIRTGNTYSAQSYVETKVDLVLDQLKGIDLDFLDSELSLDMTDFEGKVSVPAAARIAGEVDYINAQQIYKEVANSVGTPGTTPTSVTAAKVKLSENLTPDDGQRFAILDSDADAAIVTANKGLFQSSSEIARQYEDGTMAIHDGFRFKISQNLPTHTVGAHGGTPLSNGATQSGASIITDGWTASVTGLLKEGDVITFAGVYDVNFENKKQLGTTLKQFVVTADVNSDGSGNATIAISPSIVATGATQNVSNTIADNSAIVVMGTASTAYPQNLCFHKNAIAFSTGPQEKPENKVVSSMTMDGISFRIIKDWSTEANKMLWRSDILWGVKVLRPEWVVRLWG
jgi:hypothetical protein